MRRSLMPSVRPFCQQWRSQVFGGGGYTKIRTYRRPFTSAVCTSWQIWTNYETHIFKLWGVRTPRSPPPWLRHCLSVFCVSLTAQTRRHHHYHNSTMLTTFARLLSSGESHLSHLTVTPHLLSLVHWFQAESTSQIIAGGSRCTSVCSSLSWPCDFLSNITYSATDITDPSVVCLSVMLTNFRSNSPQGGHHSLLRDC